MFREAQQRPRLPGTTTRATGIFQEKKTNNQENKYNPKESNKPVNLTSSEVAQAPIATIAPLQDPCVLAGFPRRSRPSYSATSLLAFANSLMSIH